MQKVSDFFRQGDVLTLFVVVVGLLLAALMGIRLVGSAISSTTQASMYTTPHSGTVLIGHSFTLNVIVNASMPVNAFQGELTFDPSVLSVTKIDYNTAVADLWVKKPWYSNGAGTVNFAGGTTHPGGFEGSAALVTVTFTTLKAGTGSIALHNARILKADGLGSDTAIATPIDSIFTITNPQQVQSVFERPAATSTSYVVQTVPPNPDLDGDTQVNLIDLSIFMRDLVTQDKRADFNADGVVNGADLSILMSHLK